MKQLKDSRYVLSFRSHVRLDQVKMLQFFWNEYIKKDAKKSLTMTFIASLLLAFQINIFIALSFRRLDFYQSDQRHNQLIDLK